MIAFSVIKAVKLLADIPEEDAEFSKKNYVCLELRLEIFDGVSENFRSNLILALKNSLKC